MVNSREEISGIERYLKNKSGIDEKKKKKRKGNWRYLKTVISREESSGIEECLKNKLGINNKKKKKKKNEKLTIFKKGHL